MSGAFEAVHRDRIDADLLGRHAMAHRGALVDHLDAGVLELGQEGLGVVAGGLDDLDARIDDGVDVFAVGPRHQGRQDGAVDAERLVGHLAAALDLLAQVLGRRLGQRGEDAERAGVGDGRRQFGAPDPLHATLHDRVLDAEHLGEARLDHLAVSPAGSSKRPALANLVGAY